MKNLDLVIRGGEVITASDHARADVGVRDGKIVAVGIGLPKGKREIDARGLIVMPGGIDSHVHLAQPSAEGTVMADGFESGTRSAIAGGNTTVIPFALQSRGMSLRDAVADYHRKADGQAYCDYGFHIILTDPTPEALGQELPALVSRGYTSIKVFMTYDDMVLNDRELLEVFDAAGDCGALVMVHCEGYDAIRFMTEKLEKAGKISPYYHAVSRPEAVEREAAHRAISHAEITGVPIMIVHVSGREAMEQIRWARNRGLRIMGETCPQYVSLSADDLKGLNMDDTGSKYVCSPPPRDPESWAAIWSGIQTGVFQTFSSDHCPFYFEGKLGKKSAAARSSFRWVPNGIPGVAVRMPLLWSEGVMKGRISPNEFVALTSTNHARIYGLAQKGSIAPGFDADLTLWDPKRKITITQSLMEHGADYTPWEGVEVTGWPAMTILRGEIMMRDGEVLGNPTMGNFLPREISNEALRARESGDPF
ncbi:dihydropyrimidinase [Celeribacter indicus]|uniref:D-hydantoinase n=1 Tax=Celeribacter indicus TaxID=1208324 RepID=A0A0B5E5U7_9RHOB|nr:dihydropyrimidinase [Celeribacter indicus]AJE48770.1 phenylhydantoinase [Celeribacter indicus]SDX11009.1 dihydropyrimidinase [Celeribacter indicus]